MSRPRAFLALASCFPALAWRAQKKKEIKGNEAHRPQGVTLSILRLYSHLVLKTVVTTTRASGPVTQPTRDTKYQIRRIPKIKPCLGTSALGVNKNVPSSLCGKGGGAFQCSHYRSVSLMTVRQEKVKQKEWGPKEIKTGRMMKKLYSNCSLM